MIEAACARLNEEAVAADPSLASILVTKPVAEPKQAFLVKN
jgi:hypothetical protein